MVESWQEQGGSINVMQHYLLDMPDGWKPSMTSNDHRRLMLGTPVIEKCARCNHCLVKSMKQVLPCPA